MRLFAWDSGLLTRFDLIFPGIFPFSRVNSPQTGSLRTASRTTQSTKLAVSDITRKGA